MSQWTHVGGCIRVDAADFQDVEFEETTTYSYTKEHKDI